MTEEAENTVVSMGDFLMRKRQKLDSQRMEMYAKAKKLSKHDNPRDDPFAAVLMKKVDEFSEKMQGVDRHIKFLVQAMSVRIDARGYKLNAAAPTPPPVSLTFTTETPKE